MYTEEEKRYIVSCTSDTGVRIVGMVFDAIRDAAQAIHNISSVYLNDDDGDLKASFEITIGEDMGYDDNATGIKYQIHELVEYNVFSGTIRGYINLVTIRD